MNNTKELRKDIKQKKTIFAEKISEKLIFIENNIKKQEEKKNKIFLISEEVKKTNILTFINELIKENYIKRFNLISKDISKTISNMVEIKNKLNEIIKIFNKSKTKITKFGFRILEKKVNKIFSNLEENLFEISSIDTNIDKILKELIQLDNSFNDLENISFNEEDINISDNDTLIISEKENCVFLPYTVHELNLYLQEFPQEYSSLANVVKKEFIISLDYFSKYPSLARFREAYSLIRDKEAKSVFEALKYSYNMMFKYNLNPAVISACRTEEDLNKYIEFLDNNKLDKFNLFKIEYRLNPSKISAI